MRQRRQVVAGKGNTCAVLFGISSRWRAFRSNVQCSTFNIQSLNGTASMPAHRRGPAWDFKREARVPLRFGLWTFHVGRCSETIPSRTSPGSFGWALSQRTRRYQRRVGSTSFLYICCQPFPLDSYCRSMPRSTDIKPAAMNPQKTHMRNFWMKESFCMAQGGAYQKPHCPVRKTHAPSAAFVKACARTHARRDRVR